MLSNVLFTLLMISGFSALGTIYNWFSSIGHYVSGGLTYIYNNTLGDLISNFEGTSLSSLEMSALDAEAAILSFLTYISNDIGNTFSNIFTSLMDLAISPGLGVFAPMIALVLLLGLAVAVIIGVRLLIDIL
jgi:hypothetical protein